MNMNSLYILDIIYLIASVTFVIGLKMLSHPDTARRGNLVAAAGMFLAIVGTIVLHEGAVAPIIYILIFAAIAIGTVIGWMTAKRVAMTKITLQRDGRCMRCINFTARVSSQRW
jgi:proton-translocating NAD(P)+ transhydrogenase subunit beta